MIHDLVDQIGLNRAAISEFTPEGEFVQSFCGGRDVGTRLIGPISLAFAADGRLLVTSDWLTDAILAFDRGGQTVRRLLAGQYCQVCVSPSGRIYAAQVQDNRGHINRWDSLWQRDRLPGCEISEGWYFSLAINSEGHLLSLHGGLQHRGVGEFDSEGNLLRDLSIDAYDAGSLTAANDIIMNCSASYDGGGIYATSINGNNSAIVVNNCTLSNNSPTGISTNDTYVLITGSTITGNSTGISSIVGTITIDNNFVSENGVGIYAFGSLSISGNTITLNSAGGIQASYNEIITNNTISRNGAGSIMTPRIRTVV